LDQGSTDSPLGGAGCDHLARAEGLRAAARQCDLFLKHYRSPLMQYFRRRGLSRADSEDLTQMTLLRLLRKLQGTDGLISSGYVFTTASRVLIDHFRRKTLLHEGVTWQIDPQLACSEPLADQILEARQALSVVLHVLGKMRPKIRQVFKLHRFESLSYEKIADRMGLSVGSVEKYLMAALAVLRDARDRGMLD